MLSGLAVMLMASCKKNETPPPPPPPVENPAPPITPEPQTPVNPVKSTTTTTTTTTKEENPDGTSISVNGDGVSFKKKNGEKVNDVTVSKKKTEVTIKTD